MAKFITLTEGILIRDLDHNLSVTADELLGVASGNALADLEALDVNHATFRRTNSACVSPPPRLAN
jgi:hypothetical protein